MPNLIKPLVFMSVCAVLLADVGFIIWATKLNFLIVVPALLSACYLAYLAAYYTILKMEKEDKSNDLGVGVQEMRPGVSEFAAESATGGTRPVTQSGGDVAYSRAEAG